MALILTLMLSSTLLWTTLIPLLNGYKFTLEMTVDLTVKPSKSVEKEGISEHNKNDKNRRK
jgi:hypothetical protein